MIKLSIVILSYNTKDLTLACLKSVVSQYNQELEKKELEIIVIDNASTDGSQSAISDFQFSPLRASFAEVATKAEQGSEGRAISNFRLIKSKENLGFGKGCNLGAKNAGGKYVLFLNSDTEVSDNGFFGMAKFLEDNPKVAILGGRLTNVDGSLQPSAGKFYNLFNLSLMLLGLERLGFLRSSPDRIKKVDWVSGACMMVRRDIFEKLSGFDEKLFMYVEDMEICFRAEKLGYETYFYPNLILRHKSLGSSNRTFAIINIYRGVLHFYSKHKTNFEYLIAKTLLTLKAKILTLVGLLTLNPELRNRYKKALS